MTSAGTVRQGAYRGYGRDRSEDYSDSSKQLRGAEEALGIVRFFG
jgi:hypothetical protein